MGIVNEFGLEKLREIPRQGSTFCKKSLAMGTTFDKNHPWKWVWGSRLGPHTPSQPNPSTPPGKVVVETFKSHLLPEANYIYRDSWTSCFLFSSLLACFTVWPCFSVVYCCTFSFVSDHTFFLSCLILYFVIRSLGRDFVQIKSYHIMFWTTRKCQMRRGCNCERP